MPARSRRRLSGRGICPGERRAGPRGLQPVVQPVPDLCVSAAASARRLRPPPHASSVPPFAGSGSARRPVRRCRRNWSPPAPSFPRRRSPMRLPTWSSRPSRSRGLKAPAAAAGGQAGSASAPSGEPEPAAASAEQCGAQQRPDRQHQGAAQAHVLSKPAVAAGRIRAARHRLSGPPGRTEARIQRARQRARRPIDPDSAPVQRLKSAAFPLIMSLSEDQKQEVRTMVRLMGLENLASQF